MALIRVFIGFLSDYRLPKNQSFQAWLNPRRFASGTRAFIMRNGLIIKSLN
jgi:hypothetical protein